MSKICIFGADGRTGIHVVNRAISEGYSVVAFVYNKKNINQFDSSVQIIQGNILDANSVEMAVRGVDAVISVLGHIKNTDPLMQTKGIQNIIKGMKKNNVQRLISLTGTGVRITGDRLTLIDRFLNMLIGKIDPERVNDGIKHVKIIQESGLNWSILRVLKLTNSKFLGEYNLTSHGPVECFTSRLKVAKIIVDLVNSSDYIHQMPISS